MSRWETFTLTASAAPGALDSDRAYVALKIPDEAVAFLSTGYEMDDMYVPLIDLGLADGLSSSDLDHVFEVVEMVVSSYSDPLMGDLPHQFGVNNGTLWARPNIDGLDTLQARLDAELAQYQLQNASATSDLVVNVSRTNDVPDAYTMRPPQTFQFDRLALVMGDDVYEFSISALSSSAVMAAGAKSDLTFDGDTLSMPEPDDVAPADIAKQRMTGSKFYIPLVVPEGVPTGDGRVFKPMSLDTRDLPIPLMWQLKTGEGHDGSVIVGRVDTVERIDGGLGDAYGVFDAGPYGREAERLVHGKFLRGISADLDNFEAEVDQSEELPLGDEDADADAAPKKSKMKKIASANIEVSKARVMGITLVAKPAFQECFIELVDDSEQEPLVADGTYVDTLDAGQAEAITAAALIASHIPNEPPKSWFENPRLTKPTALTITDEGRVFGHIAAWHVDHIGLPFGTRPPRSRSNYAYFHTGVCRTEEGEDVPVGQLTLAGGHAPLEATAAAAVKHYDDTASGAADVHAGEDAYGIWVAGALRPGTTPEQVRVLRASAPSGDWRPIGGRLEMVAVCQVNVPGFPVARARVASGYVTALVAAGAQALAELRGPTVEERLAEIERQLSSQVDVEARTLSAQETERLLAAKATMARHRVNATLAAREPGISEFRAYTKEKREEYLDKGWAIKNYKGSIAYPIRDIGDLRNAIKAYGRAAKEDKAKVRKHIIKRARGLDRADLIPDGWMKAASISARMQLAHENPDYAVVEDGVALGMTAALRYRRERNPDWFKPENHPRDASGRFRKVLFRLKKDLEGKTGTKEAIDKIEEAEDAEAKGEDDRARDAAEEVITIIDKLADDTTNADDQEMLRIGAGELGKVMAYLPLPQGQVATKMKFTELPVELRDLIEDLVDRAAAKMDNDQFDEVAGEVKSYMSGGDYMDSDEIQSHLNRIVRMLI